MYFEYTITNEIYVDRDDFRRMKRLVQAGKTYDEAFEEVSTSWDDEDYCNRDEVRNAVIAELKRRMAQAEEAGK
jgi:hypothetical protein